MKRRAFLGLVAALPIALPIVGASVPQTIDVPRPEFPESDAIELPSDLCSSKAVTHGAYARLMLRLVDRQLRLRPVRTLTVGPDKAHVGDTWGSGTFTKRIYAFIEDVPVARSEPRKVLVDKVFTEEMARQIADSIVAHGLTKFGRPPDIKHGLLSCTVAANRRLALRFVTTYEVFDDRVKGRFDFIGGA